LASGVASEEIISTRVTPEFYQGLARRAFPPDRHPAGSHPCRRQTLPRYCIRIGPYGNPAELTATGLDRGVPDYVYYFGCLVNFQ
jgi:hypothetical protein